MRHQKHKITLDRKSAARNALIRSLAESLILREKILTTKAKGKAAQSFVERLVSVAKKNNLAARRQLIAKLGNHSAVNKLLDVLSGRYADRAGGCTRLTMVNNRKGDGADVTVVEFI